MIKEEKNIRQFLLEDLIKKLAGVSALELIYASSHNLYHELKYIFGTTDFIPSYASVFTVLTQINAESSSEYSLVNLSDNLTVLKGIFFSKRQIGKNPDYVYKGISSLQNYIDLEVANIRYLQSNINKLTDQNNKQNDFFKVSEKKLNDYIREIELGQESAFNSIQKELGDRKASVDGKLSKLQERYISVFGIFSSVIVAFTNGMIFSGTVLDHIYYVSSSRVILMICLIGIIAFSVIWSVIDVLLVINGNRNSIRKKWILDTVNLALVALSILAILNFKLNLL